MCKSKLRQLLRLQFVRLRKALLNLVNMVGARAGGSFPFLFFKCLQLLTNWKLAIFIGAMYQTTLASKSL